MGGEKKAQGRLPTRSEGAKTLLQGRKACVRSVEVELARDHTEVATERSRKQVHTILSSLISIPPPPPDDILNNFSRSTDQLSSSVELLPAALPGRVWSEEAGCGLVVISASGEVCPWHRGGLPPL